jgi:hypothetical protein
LLTWPKQEKQGEKENERAEVAWSRAKNVREWGEKPKVGEEEEQGGKRNWTVRDVNFG